MKRSLIIFCLLSSVLCPLGLRAEALRPEHAAAIYMMAWGQHGGPLPEHPPTIEFHSAAQLRALIGCEKCTVRGIQIGDTIHADIGLDFSDAYDASILLHEMVHYLQWVANGEAAGCADWVAREHRAFRIQANVLARAGVSTAQVMLNARMVRCHD